MTFSERLIELRQAVEAMDAERQARGGVTIIGAATSLAVIDCARALVAACPPQEEPKRWWMVVRKRETDPAETTLFDRYDEAAMFWDRAQAQWSEVYFCRVVFGPRDVVGDMERPVVVAALPGAVPAQEPKP